MDSEETRKMSSQESPDNNTPEVLPAGVIPASRPLRKPKAVEEEDLMPHIPSRPLRRSSTENSKELEIMERVKSIEEAAVPSSQANENNQIQGNAPYVPNRPVHHESVATESEPIIPKRPTIEPHAPTRAMRKQISLDTEAVYEPQIPSRPIRKVASVNTEIDSHPIIPVRPNLKNTGSDTEKKDTTKMKTPEEGLSVSSTETEESVIPSGPAKIAKPSIDSTNEEEKYTGLLEEKLQEKMNANDYDDLKTSETESNNDDTELVEPLMPKRPIRRTTGEIPSPMVPHRPKKATTLIELETIKKDVPLSVDITPIESDTVEQGESDGAEDVKELEEEVTPVDIINPTTLDSEQFLLQKDNAEAEGLQAENKTSISTKGENEQLVEGFPPVIKNTKLNGDENLALDEAVTKEERGEEVGKKDIKDSVIIETKSTEQPSVPSRPMRKGPPPVPKKPSSKIAAFHQMLQRQQMKNLGLENEEEAIISVESSNDTPEHSSTTTEADDKSTSTQPQTMPIRPSQLMGNSMNGIFALPGMVPGGMLPAGLSKKLGISTEESSNSNTENGSKGALSDVRQKRARGPRGRKLPSKINNIKKVVDTTENNEIEIFNTWTVTMTPQPIVEENIVVPSNIAEEMISESNDFTQGNIDDVENITEKVEPKSLKDEKEVCTMQLDVNKPIDIQSDFDIERTEIEAPISIGEKIENRDEDEQAIAMEQKVEDMAEALMEQEMLKDDIDENDIEERNEEELYEEEMKSPE